MAHRCSQGCAGYTAPYSGSITTVNVGMEVDMEIFLNDIAHGRSGDKGDTSNICVFARRPEYYKIIEIHGFSNYAS